MLHICSWFRTSKAEEERCYSGKKGRGVQIQKRKKKAIEKKPKCSELTQREARTRE